MKCALRIFEVRRGFEIVELDKDDILVGRDASECDIVLDPMDLTASRRHFSIQRRPQDFFLFDSSKCGTTVNGVAVGGDGRKLYHGDVIEAGNAELTFLIFDEPAAAREVFEAGKKEELYNPAYALQCYSLAFRKEPQNIDIAESLLLLLEREERIETVISGGDYFNPEDIMKLAGHARVAAPLARAFTRIGDFTTAADLIDRAGGENAHPALKRVYDSIQKQTAGELLRTVTKKFDEPFNIQREALRVLIDDQADLVDFRYIERYHKYLGQRIDELYGGKPGREVVFHVTMRDQLFARTSPEQHVVLGYFSPQSKRIFIRPSRWRRKIQTEQELSVVLLHEYVHFRNDETSSGLWFPRWYNEGIAHVFSGSLSLQHCRNQLRRREDSISIPDLHDGYFSQVHDKWGTAYTQSAAIVHYLSKSYDDKKIVDVLRMLESSGGNFDRAFEQVFDLTLVDLDNKWWVLLEGQ
jgi:hypothetical protein